MIYLDRPLPGPASLQKPEIQHYLDALQQFLAVKRDLVETPTKEPKHPGNLRDQELLDAFEHAFHNKCWLTERKFTSSSDLEVDHFETVAEAPSRRYDWTNLLPIDPKVNKLRPKTTPKGGYLDPCRAEDDVENRIDSFLLLTEGGERIGFAARDSEDVKAVNTAKLLDRVHNGHNPHTRESTLSVRKAIFQRERTILEAYKRYGLAKNDNEKRLVAMEIKEYFSREASFTMLMRMSKTGLDLAPIFSSH